jgi:hypothetical protein
MHDDLGRVLSLTVPRGGRVCYAATATAFKGAAWDLGRAVGCIEGLLHDLNVYPDDERVVEVNDSTWRSKIFTKKERETVAALATPVLRRAAWKQLAVDTVARKYRVEVDDNAAEAILLNDYIAIYREATYAAVPL